MKNRVFILFLFLFLFISQVNARVVPEFKKQEESKYRQIVINNDTMLMVYLDNVYVYPPLKFKNKKEEKKYWKTVRDVKKTLPYAKLIYSILIETYEYIETLPDDEARDKHLKRMEKEIFKQYKPILKKLTYSQGKMLIKLIDRECNQSSYELIRAFLGGFRANFWQLFGKMFGASLKVEYDPDGKDKVIESICVQLERELL